MEGVCDFSGERFEVVYRLSGDAAEVSAMAQAMCLEQTVEFPDALLPPGAIREHVVGQVVSLVAVAEGGWEARLSYAVETVGGELTQFLNVVFGNTSLKPGVRVERLDVSPRVLGLWRGPRFGCVGLRERLGVWGRPLVCTALKPMGLGVEGLADLAFAFALGGIDIVKDDHGLADQAFAPFRERVLRCCDAVQRANRQTGRGCVYVPNVTGPADQVVERARFARDAGAGGLLVAPGLVGWDVLRVLAEDDGLALPLMCHPAFLGGFVASPVSGVSHFALFGQLVRLVGADATIFPNFGGRFSFSRAECGAIVAGCAAPMGHVRPIFPTPGGGMSLARVGEMRALYGDEVIFLIGGGLHSHGPDLIENCRFFLRLVEGGA